MYKNNIDKRTWVLIGVFVVVAVVGIALIRNMDRMAEKKQQELSNQQGQTSGVAPSKGGTATQTQTYTKLVTQYKDRRIQFDAMCQAKPNNVTYKNGTSVMFDNRSGDARIITIGGVKYSFPGYGYKILTLSSPILPKTLLLSCGAAVNVGQILLQK